MLKRFILLFITISLIVFILIACGNPKRAQIAIERAEKEYIQYSKTNPPSSQLQLFRSELNKAKYAYDRRNFDKAEKHALKASEILREADKIRKNILASLKGRQEKVLDYICSQLSPSGEVEDYYDESVEALSNNNPEKAEIALSKAENYIKRHTSITKNQSVTLDSDVNWMKKYGGIKVYMGIDKEKEKLVEEIGQIEQGTVVKFIRTYRINKGKKFYFIQTYGGDLQGWVYPEFVVKGNY